MNFTKVSHMKEPETSVKKFHHTLIAMHCAAFNFWDELAKTTLC